MLIKQAYTTKVEHLGLSNDAAQLRIVDSMQNLQERIIADSTPARRILYALHLRTPPEQGCGLYLWGGVGRGKTFLMDLFFKTLPVERKRRVHFHRMMSEVHARLREFANIEDPLDRVAGEIARKTSVLCFDEFFVADIGDAMILGRLLHSLFKRGVILVATSNSAPRELYRSGLQRERFLPAIELLEKKTLVLHIDGDTDFRLRLLQKAGTYLVPAGNDATANLDRYFREIASGEIAECTLVPVLGRGIAARKQAKGIVWFDFKSICEGPRSQRDYIELARWYPTVIVSDVPRLTAEQDNATRRFISLVDEFYDRRVKLILTAATTIASLYTGTRLAFEFQRTVSRLTEMQTTDYLHSEHLS
jgi:cell division protein ZapE